MNPGAKALLSIDLSSGSATTDVLHLRPSLRVEKQLNFRFFLFLVKRRSFLKLPTFDETRRDWLSSFTFMPKTHHL